MEDFAWRVRERLGIVACNGDSRQGLVGSIVHIRG